MTLIWRGKQVVTAMEAAEIDAINTTMAAAVIHAKSNHGPGARASGRFESQTGSLERSVRITTPGRAEFTGSRGQWGSTDIVYARRIELGFQGKDSLGRVINQPALPFLSPAASEEYPKLAGRIREAWLANLRRRKGRKSR